MIKTNEEIAQRKKVLIARNTTGLHLIWDSPALASHRDNPLPASIRFVPYGKVAFIALQADKLNSPPAGIVVEDYDESKHGPINYAGE